MRILHRHNVKAQIGSWPRISPRTCKDYPVQGTCGREFAKTSLHCYHIKIYAAPASTEVLTKPQSPSVLVNICMLLEMRWRVQSRRPPTKKE